MAADHEEIAAEVRRFGGRVELTDPLAPSGTDRVAEVARAMPDMDVLVNVQGDEPEIAGTSIDLVVQLLENDSQAVMATLATAMVATATTAMTAAMTMMATTTTQPQPNYSTNKISLAGRTLWKDFPPNCGVKSNNDTTIR